MKNLLLTTALAFTFSAPVFAAGTHNGGHDAAKADDHAEMAMGMPGDAHKVDRTIDVILVETDDGEMLIKGEDFDIKQGETIRFKIRNKGELEHEFVLDTMEENAEHKEMMAKMDMEHDDPNSIRLDSGQDGEIIWTFANAGTFEAACLIPGHYESGMYREVTVNASPAQADMTMAQAEVKYSTGTVKKIDAKAGKVTVAHGPLVNLDMPSMTMVFRADEDMIAKMSEGQDIEFVEERVEGKLTIVQMK